MKRLLIKNIGLLQTPIGKKARRGYEQKENIKICGAAILAEDGIIKEIYEQRDPRVDFDDLEIIDAEGALVTPGLVEAHTHMIFGGFRQKEIPLKIQGASYLDILAMGGGIMDTVNSTRKASYDDLYKKTYRFLDEMASLGVTTAEAKSGYGLDLETELKCLRVLKDLNEKHPIEVVSTFMGAHATAKEYEGRGDDFISFMTDEVMPRVKEEDLAEFADVFLEKGVFDVEQSKRYLEAARQLGFKLKIHADEIESIGGSKLAGEIGATSAEHLISIDEEGLSSLAKSDTVAVLLPGTSFYLGANFAPAREMINRAIPVAISTDFNPGSCPSLNIQFVLNLAMLKYKMLPEEVLTAASLNAAAAIDRADKIGSIEPGKACDLAIWQADDFDMVCYRYGSNQNKMTIKKGRVIWKRN